MHLSSSLSSSSGLHRACRRRQTGSSGVKLAVLASSSNAEATASSQSPAVGQQQQQQQDTSAIMQPPKPTATRQIGPRRLPRLPRRPTSPQQAAVTASPGQASSNNSNGTSSSNHTGTSSSNSSVDDAPTAPSLPRPQPKPQPALPPPAAPKKRAIGPQRPKRGLAAAAPAVQQQQQQQQQQQHPQEQQQQPPPPAAAQVSGQPQQGEVVQQPQQQQPQPVAQQPQQQVVQQQQQQQQQPLPPRPLAPHEMQQALQQLQAYRRQQQQQQRQQQQQWSGAPPLASQPERAAASTPQALLASDNAAGPLASSETNSSNSSSASDALLGSSAPSAAADTAGDDGGAAAAGNSAAEAAAAAAASVGQLSAAERLKIAQAAMAAAMAADSSRIWRGSRYGPDGTADLLPVADDVATPVNNTENNNGGTESSAGSDSGVAADSGHDNSSSSSGAQLSTERVDGSSRSSAVEVVLAESESAGSTTTETTSLPTASSEQPAPMPDHSASTTSSISSVSSVSSSEGSSSEGGSSAADRRRRRSSRRQSRAEAAVAAPSEPAAPAQDQDTHVPPPAVAATLQQPALAAQEAAAATIEAVGSTADGPSAAPQQSSADAPGAGPTTRGGAADASPADAHAAGPSSTSPPAPAAARRRDKAATDSNAGGTGLSAQSVVQMLQGQRKLRAATAGTGGASGSSTSKSRGSSSSSRGTTDMGKPGDIVPVNGRWVLSGFDADREAMGNLVPALQQRLTAGVQAEQEQEAAALKRLYATSTLRSLQRDGIVLLGLAATPSHVLYSSMVWRFSLAAGGLKQQQQRQGGGGLPYHRFRQGDSLLVSRWSEEQLVDVSPANSRSHGTQHGAVERSNDLKPGSDGFRPLDATVVEVRKDHLLLAFDKAESDRMDQERRLAPAAALVSWRLDQSVRDTTARRQLEAIRRLSAPTTDSPFEALLRMVLVGTANGAYGASVPPEWVRDADWRQDVKALLEQTQGLNNSQRRAIALAVVRSFTLWQGPPGTGKTRTLLALVEVLVKTAQKNSRRWAAMGPILACGDTNAAVDNLVEGLLHKGLRVVRLGQPAKVRASLQQYTLQAQAEKTPDGQRAVQLRQDSKVLFEQSKQLAEGSVLSWSNKSRPADSLTRSGRARSTTNSSSSSTRTPATRTASAPVVGSSEGLEKEAKRKWAEAERLAKRSAQQVLQEAQVVCATCSGAGDPLLNELHFNMVVVDEATQATEPATLVPLTQGARCVVMAGDPAQLPPTVTSKEAAQQHGLTVTLFERLQRTLGMEPLLLDTQYRMNPAISAFPSRQFYQSKLKDGVTAEQKPAAAGVAWPQPEQPVMVVAVEGMEEQARKSKAKAADGSDILQYGQDAAGGLMESSYRNLQEARVTLQAAYALMTAGDASSAAILTPYKGQVRTFEHALRVLAPWFGPDLLSRITVSSVDGYQGREADVVLFSAVRCNAAGRIGFVSDRRRLNVAITRPRRGLIVICSPDTLQKGCNDWAAFLSYSNKQGWVTGPEALPAAPWQLEDPDPFGEGIEGVESGVGGRSGSGSATSWSSVASSCDDN